MSFRDITKDEKTAYNKLVSHPLQTYEWGQFREKTGVTVIRRGFYVNNLLSSAYQISIHRIPYSPFTIGYVPKGDLPTKQLIEDLRIIGRKSNCLFIQLEPNVEQDNKQDMKSMGLVPAAHPLFTKYTFILDLTLTEDELLKNMHHKARYNIRVALRHGVEIVEDNSKEAFEQYWSLMEETTKRQKFYAHTKQYHYLQWELFAKSKHKDNSLTSHLFLAKYQGKVLTAWVLFVCGDTLYYPYGASSNANREVMSNNLIMWEAIKFGKALDLKKFDMWGAMGPSPDPHDPWFGFHTFKERYGPRHVEFIGSFDLVLNPALYEGYKMMDRLRWILLRLRK